MYKHLFFDLDRTLWDFERNSKECLQEMYSAHGLSAFFPTTELFLSLFDRYNNLMWREFERGNARKETMRLRRFELMFKDVGKKKEKNLIKQLSEEYLVRCPMKPHLFDNALEILTYLENKYHLHLLSNGFEEIQSRKMNASGIQNHFKHVITCDNSGYVKPDPRIFKHALVKAGAQKEESLMIGDDVENDIEGANRFGMDSCFVNYENKEGVKATYTVVKLEELKKFL